jgi:DNA repair exonuclease SbcCD ATPase subunit
MILFEKIRYRNFLSTGNHFIEIDFSNKKTNLILGSNGAGKSTFLDALTFVLFGKSFRGINKPQLINSTNDRDCLVEIEFKISKNSFVIRRGIKPGIFEIYKNQKLIDQVASNIDQQKWFESNILKMNYKSFTQIVILGSSNFVPFMQLSSSHRREVIEDLLDLKIFSSMHNIVKENIKLLKEEITELTLNKNSLEDKIEYQEKFLNEIQTEGNKRVQSKQEMIENLIAECEKNNQENISVETKIEKLTSKLETLESSSTKLKKLGNIQGKLNQKIRTISSEKDFFDENSVCPTCTQDIEERFRLNRISELQNKIVELNDGYQTLKENIQSEENREKQFVSVSKEITKLTHDVSTNNTRISGNQRQIKHLESEIQRITTDIENRNTEYEKLNVLNHNLKQLNNDILLKKESINLYNFSYTLLKDTGVKTKIIKKYLPLINQQVNRYLQMMDFYINFTLNEEFDESIQSPIHENFTYDSFSQGERQRIDLSLLFAWREIARIKNSVSTNLIIFDEVFDSSLDGFGTDEFLKIIRFVIQDANIFVISHKQGLEDKFDNVINFSKVKGFSQVSS